MNRFPENATAWPSIYSTSEESKAKKTFKDLSAGTIAGIGLVLTGHPLDTLKVRLQTQPMDKPVYNGLVDCARKTMQWEGFGGFYRGVGSPLLGQMFLRAYFFGVYEKMKDVVSGGNGDRVLSISQTALAGGLTGFWLAFLESPVDFFKSQLQVQIIRQQRDPNYRPPFRNIFQCAGYIGKNHGGRGIYQGLSATLIRNVPANFCYFGANETVRHLLNPTAQKTSDYTTQQLMAAGTAAGIMYWMPAYPLDVIKSAMMGDHLNPAERKYAGFADCARKLYAEGGVRRFYKGVSACFLRSMPANAVMLTLYEKARQWMD